jgi:anti-sigma factor RsiW
MTHDECQQSISLYVDNALSDKESSGLFAHLAGCDECRTFMKISMRVRAQSVDEESAEVPRDLDRHVLSSVKGRSVDSNRRSWYSPVWFTRISIPLPAAASLLFLIIVGSLLVSPLLTQGSQAKPEIPAELLSRIPSSLQRPF